MKMKIKKRYILIILIIIAVTSILFFRNRQKSSTEKYITEKVKRGILRQIVSATGTVIPPSEIELNSSVTGKIVEMNVKIGDKVIKDQVLAKLDDKDSKIKVSEALASLNTAKADLNKLLQGARNEDIAVSVVNVNKAETDYKNELKTLEDIKSQSAQDIKSAEDNLKNIKEKTAKDVTTYNELVKSAETTLANAEQSLVNSKNTKQQAIDNAKEDALTVMDTKLFVGSASLNMVYDILDDDDVKAATLDPGYFDLTKGLYETAKSNISLARETLGTAQKSNTVDDIKAALTKTNEALNKTFETLSACYNVLVNSAASINLTKIEIDAYKADVKTEQTSISTALTSLQASRQNLDTAILDYNSTMDSAQATVNNAKRNLDETKSKLSLAQTSKDTQILSAENSLKETKIAANKKINDTKSLVDSYYNQWQLMEKQLSLKKSSPLSSEIEIYRSRIKQSEANLAAANENLGKTILRAPIDGVITKKNYEIGEQTSLGKSMFSMMIINNYEIEVAIPESDIVKIKIGQPILSTLDAYDENIKFKGNIIFIEPAETIIQDVVYYKVKIALDKSEYAIKSGMTANVDIETAKKGDILMLPQRAIITNGKKNVRILKNGQIEELEVETGLRGEDGMVEIISGIKESDEIVVYIKK